MSGTIENYLTAPHAHAPMGVSGVMGNVILALLPAVGLGVWLFGWPALNLVLLTVASCMAGEAFGTLLSGRDVWATLKDGSALLTGLLLAMTLPPWAPWWVAVVGGLFAILIGKQVFGGLGQNVFNPAMLARVTLLVAFPVELTTWVKPLHLGSAAAPDFMQGLAITFGNGIASFDGVTGASLLGATKTALTVGQGLSQSLAEMPTLFDFALGLRNGSLGETAGLFILGGGIYLLSRRIITWHVPVAMLGTVALLAGLFHAIDPERYLGIGHHLLSGAMLLGAFFIATDYVTSPSTPLGQLLFGAGCGALVFVIRTWGGFPEGVAFAVLLMNAATPLIDHYLRPRIYGRTRKGEPLTPVNPPRRKEART